MEKTIQHQIDNGVLAVFVGILAALIAVMLILYTKEHTEIVAPPAIGVVQWNSDTTSWTGGWR